MNKFSINGSGVNNGMPFEIYTPSTKDQVELQADEIFEIQHYKSGKIKKNMTVIDCGANIGLASIYFKDDGKIIYAIEPNSQNYQALVENTKGYKNIKTFHTGLSSMTTLQELRGNAGNLIGETLFGDGAISETVKMFSIEDFMTENQIEHVDLLKFDTEGAEYLVFPSAAFAKVAQKIDYIVGEAHYFSNFVPSFLPLILADKGFDMKYLPITNMFLVFHWEELGAEKTYQVEERTIFIAKRKELPWPSGL